MRVQDEKTKVIDGAVSRRKILLGGTTLAAATAMGSAGPIQTVQAQQQRPASVSAALPADQIGEVAVSAYLYAYPLISMEMARRISTNVADTRQFAKAPMNQFAHVQGSLSRVLAIGFGSGLLLVLGSMVYIVRLDRQTQELEARRERP